MGKKRKAVAGASAPKGAREYDPADARLGPVTSYKDLADSEEEYFENQDQIMFGNDEPRSKKQRRQDADDDFLENSDEEVFNYGDDASDDDDDDEDAQYEKPKAGKKASRQPDSDDDQPQGDAEGEGDSGWWGSSRKEYYDNDEVENENDALEEEQEARRLQKKKLAKMTDDDFIFDENEWLGAEADEAADQDDVVTEVLKDVEIPADMSPADRYRLLQTRYPELDHLADELLQLQPLLVSLQKEAENQEPRSLPVVKYRVLGSYVATLALYFATLTSPARDGGSAEAKALNPAELREHEVMTTLLECREAWKSVEQLEAPQQKKDTPGLLSPPEEGSDAAVDEDEAAPVQSTKKPAKDKESKKARAKAKAIEESLKDLDSLLAAPRTKKAKKQAAEAAAAADEDNSDFGEEETLDSRAAAEKAARKKSLRFYTSQIAQKANRRAEAGRDAGGDNDIPYRERLKDRQARLNAEAEKRGKKGASSLGADLGSDSGDEDRQQASAMRDDEDEYYDMVSSKKKQSKAAREAAIEAEKQDGRVVETEEVGEDGKRKITYQIEKNKGLAPRRKKDVRNPRVKKRKKYDEKQKKLRSMKAVYKGGEGKGGYGGELTGIKPGLIKSVKL